jgi:hypothetical protein
MNNHSNEHIFNKTGYFPEYHNIERTISYLNLIILIFSGILGNICCIYVYLQKSMRKRKFHWYLLVLAIFELIFSLILSLDYLFKMLNKDSIFLHDVNVYINMFIDYLIHMIDSYTTVLILILSIDRLYAIKHLTDQRNFITYKHAKLLILFSLLAILVLKIPFTMLCYINTDKYFNIISCTIVSPLIFNLIPTIAILVVYLILVVRLIKFYRKLSNSRRLIVLSREGRQSELNLKICRRNSDQNMEINTYKFTFYPLCRTQKVQFIVILVKALWSILINISYYPLSMFYFYITHFNFQVDIVFVTNLQIISSTFFNVNHSIHFFIYFSFNFEFRKCLIKIFKKR